MEHRDITGANVHEPKGIEGSIKGEVYVSTVEEEGVGPFSGEWRLLSFEDISHDDYLVPRVSYTEAPSRVSLSSYIVSETDGSISSVSDFVECNKNFQELFTLLDNVNRRLSVLEDNHSSVQRLTTAVAEGLTGLTILKEEENV